MSSLGLSLLILIVLAIAALAGYNFWVNRKPSSQSRLDPSPVRVSKNEGIQRQEPSFSIADTAEPAASVPGPATPNQPTAQPDANDTDGASPVTPTDAPATPSWAAGTPDSAESSGAEPNQALDWRQASQFDPTADELEESARAPADEEISDQLVGEIEKTLAEVESAAVEHDEIVSGEQSVGVPETDPVEDRVKPIDDQVALHQELDTERDTAAVTQVGQVSQSDAGPVWSGVDLDRTASKFVTSVTLELPQALSGEDLLERTAGVVAAGSKPIRVSGGNAGDMVANELKTMPLNPGVTYGFLRFELLQVNRLGPVDGVEYSEFVRAVNEVGDKLGVLTNVPDMNVVLIRSRVLDAEVASLDAQVAVNVETEQAIEPEQFVAFAVEQKLRHVNGNKFLNVSTDGWTINSVELDQAANRIVMVLDVPTIPRELQPIRQMVECAWKFAQAYDGKMIDDSGRLIDNPLFERIESQLDIHYQALLAAGVPAGSDLARQVYNSD